MALIVEDGTNVTGAESYESVAGADLYHSNRGTPAAQWSSLTTSAKEQSLRRATDYMTQAYRTRWTGYRTYPSQALDWPRTLVSLRDVSYGGVFVDQFSMPDAVKNACSALAWMSISVTLAPNIERETASESVGDISVSYFQGSTQYTVYRSIDLTLRHLLINNGNGVSLVRA